MRCGKAFPPPETPACLRARAFAERERDGPFFGAYPKALDFSLASLPCLDVLIDELWGVAGAAPGQADWQPEAARLQVIIDFGMYLGEVLCRHLPANWEMDAAQPQNLLGARVVDAQGRRINPCAQMAIRFRDGAGLGMASLYTALTGKEIPPWRLPPQSSAEHLPATPTIPVTPPSGQVAQAPGVAVVDIATELANAAAHVQRGHWGNAISCYRRVIASDPNLIGARRQLIRADQFIHQAERMSVTRVHKFGFMHMLNRRRHPDQAREPSRPAPTGNQTETDLR